MEQENGEEIPRTRRIIFTAPIETIEGSADPAAVQIPEIIIGAPLEADMNTTAASADQNGPSIEDLRRQQDELARQIEEKQAAEKAAVIDQILKVSHTYNVTIEELVEAFGGLKIKRQGVKAIQKYKDPKTGATWSGRGKEPVWIRGKNRDKFLIKD